MRLQQDLGQLAERDVVEHRLLNMLGEGVITRALLLRKVWEGKLKDAVASVAHVGKHESLVAYVG